MTQWVPAAKRAAIVLLASVAGREWPIHGYDAENSGNQS